MAKEGLKFGLSGEISLGFHVLEVMIVKYD